MFFLLQHDFTFLFVWELLRLSSHREFSIETRPQAGPAEKDLSGLEDLLQVVREHPSLRCLVLSGGNGVPVPQSVGFRQQELG